jgi:predicted Zn-dependent protease
VSIDAERGEIDEAMWARSSAQYGAPIGSEEVTGYLASIGDGLTPFAPTSAHGPDAWTWCVFDDDRVQAFTTIDGRVALTRGLIERLSTEDELAAIVARQIAHARLQHEWQFMINQINAAGFFISPKGAVSDGGTRGAKVEYASWLFTREGEGFMHPFQAWQLVEADEAAMKMLGGAGYDPGAIRRALAISEEGGTQYAYTYGHVAERRRAVEAWLGARGEVGPGREGDGGFDSFKSAIGDAAG